MANEVRIKELLIKEIVPGRQYLVQSEKIGSFNYILNDNEEWECDDKSIESTVVVNIGGSILDIFNILTIGELMPTLFNSSFKEAETGIIYKFIHPDSLNINGLPVSKFTVNRNNGELFLISDIDNVPLLINLVDENPVKIDLINKDKNRVISLLQG